MEQQQYTSCIKINGVPILPPLMTDDLRTEMNYYKQLAIAVEEKLKALEITRDAEIVKREKNGFEECKILETKMKKGDCYDSTTEDSYVTETETSTVESGPNTDTVIDLPTKENPQTEYCASLDTSASESIAETINLSCKSCNDDASKERNEDFFAPSTCSDTITASTDLNQYLDASPPTQRTSATVTPELVKPKVPKTLDIIPITVEVPKRGKTDDSSDETPLPNTPPKLVRQGSYILEAPSPMLLAHMQTELKNPEYVPTTTSVAIKRKEWNISQAKSEWENQIKNKQFVIPDSSRSKSAQGRTRRNSMSTVNNQKIFKSLSHSKTSSSLGGRQSARSVDCIQTMLDKELVRKSPVSAKGNNCGQRHGFGNGSSATKNNNNQQKWNSNRNVSILNLANKLGGSLGNLTNFEGQPGHVLDVKNGRIQPTIIEDKPSTPSTEKAVPMSEKLVFIFKEIQRKHEEQMAELIIKQQREQNNMQKEFEKQQVLLLGQIKKTFPGISIPPPVEAEQNISANGSASPVESANLVSNQEGGEDDIYSSYNNNPPVAKCLLDYIYPMNGHCEIPPSKNVTIRPNLESSGCLKSDELPLEYNDATKTYGDDKVKSVGCNANSIDRYSNVSRQLFPLDSNTVHVPVPVNILYTAKHIRAATTINAYARGYLVRRLMKTERVIALKNTYKEALHCMLKLHVDAPLNLPELNFHQRLQLQCDAASMNIAELFAQSPKERMQVISQDREIKRSRSERPSSAHSYSFATQRTLARKKLKEMGNYSSPPVSSRPSTARSRCQTWTSNSREKRSQNIYHGIKRSTSAGTVRKPWR